MSNVMYVILLYAALYRVTSTLRRNVIRQNGAAPKRPAIKRPRQNLKLSCTTFSSYLHMCLGNCLGSCDRYLESHSAQAVSYKASPKLGNLTD